MSDFELVSVDGRDGIKCLACGRTSYHPADVTNRYCGKCHVFHDDPAPPRYRAGELVTLAIGGKRIAAVVGLASDNGRSLMLAFDDAAPLNRGGIMIGTLPVLFTVDGWREIMRLTPCEITPGHAAEAGDA